MTRAAAALHLTQSAVSGAIHALESRHDVKLFHRVGRRIELTDEGREFVLEAKAIMSQVRSAEARLHDLSGVRRGSLAVFASQTIAAHWLPRHLVRFHEEFPQIQLCLEVGNTAQCAQAVLAGAASLGFVEGTIEENSLSVKIVAWDRLVLVVGRDHPWTRSTPRFPEDIHNTEWALREPGSGTRSSFEDAVSAMGVMPAGLHVAMELPSTTAICTAVEAGRLATAVSELVAKAGVESGRLVVVPFDLPPRAFSLIRHRERHHSRAAEAFCDTLTADLEEDHRR